MELRERDFDAFFAAPFEAYGRDTTYVSPMQSDLRRFLAAEVNPLFPKNSDFTWFTAHRAGRVLGRITAHAHPASNAKFGTKRPLPPEPEPSEKRGKKQADDDLDADLDEI